MDKRIEEFNKYFGSVVTDNIDRYGIPFSTERYKYFFDTGTGKVLRCTEPTFHLLCHLFEHMGKVNPEELALSEEEFDIAVGELKKAIDNENILKAKKFETFVCAHTQNLEEIVGKECKQLILEVTEKCNLRCRYCIYGEETKNFRTFSTKDMTFDIAKKAMDYALSIASDNMILSFYGGEPLIQYKLIRTCTEYFKEHFQGEKISFVMTSNLTLLTKEMADFFSEHKFVITCSLDGDRENQNRNRPYAGGVGSFDDTIRGLKLLVDSYGDDAKEHVFVNTVIDRPYTTEKFEKIDTFFRSLTWLPEGAVTTSYAARDEWDENIELSPNKELIHGGLAIVDTFGDWIFEKMREKDSEYFSENIVKDSLLNIHKRLLYNKPLENCSLNGCCVPGARRLYVTVDGKFSLCERIGNVPDIGNVEEGINLEKIKKYYIDEYIEQSIKNCSNCWAVQMCNVCYARCFDENGLDMKRKKMLCESMRFSLYDALRRYYTIVEENPEMLQKYNETDLT